MWDGGDWSESERKKSLGCFYVYIVFRWWNGNTLTAIDIMRKIYWIFAPTNNFRYAAKRTERGGMEWVCGSNAPAETGKWGEKVDGRGGAIFVVAYIFRFVDCLWSFVLLEYDDEIDSFCGLESTIIKAIFSAFMSASFPFLSLHACGDARKRTKAMKPWIEMRKIIE